jgi:hypothetical protein
VGFDDCGQNHVGRPWKAYDGAGLVEEYDFKEEGAKATDEP